MAQTGNPEHFEIYLRALKMWFEIGAYCPESDHFVAVFDVITERKQAETSLRASEAKLKAISTAALDAIIMIDSEGNVMFWNPAAERTLGYSASEIMGKNLHGLSTPKRYKPDFDRGLAEFKRTGQGPLIGKTVEASALHRDGHEFPVEVSLASVRQNDQWCAVGVVRDISARKQAEASLRLSEERFRNSFDFAGIAMGVMDLDGRFLQVNPACCAMLGYTEEELLHTSSQAITHPDDVSGDLANRDELLAGKISSYQIEKRNIDNSGRTLWVLKTASLVRDAEGRPLQILAQVQDITAGKQTEQKLQQSEERFALAVEGANDGIWDWNFATRKVYFSPRYKAMIGYADHEMKDRFVEWQQRVHPDDLAGTMAQLRAYLKKRSPTYQPEFRLRCKDGSYRWILARAKAIWDEKGKAIRLTGSHTDITDRKKAEEELRLSEERFRRITTNMLDLVVQVDPEGAYEYVTPSTLSVLGYRSEDLIGKSFFPLMHPEDLERTFLAFKTAMETGTPAYGEYRFRKANGEYIWLEAIGTRLLDDDGKVCGGLIACRDITERKRAREALRASRDLLSSVLEHAPIRVFWKDRNLRYLGCNSLFAHDAGVAHPEDLLGKDDFHFGWSEQAERYRADDQRVMDLDQPIIGYEEPQTSPAGDTIWLRTSKVPLHDGEGKVIGMLGIYDDISEQKQANEEIRRLNAELEQKVLDRTAQLEAANKELESFAYSVSHDLRAPLRGIDGFSQALLEDYNDKLDADGQDYLRRVRAAVQRMNRLIEDILQLSRLNRSAKKSEEVDLSVIAAHVVAELRAADPARHVDIRLKSGLMANGDGRLLEVVLTNLIGNAWKFTSKTEDARIELGVSETDGKCVFFVRDNGAGFDMANVDRLFGAFQRLHTEAEFPGTGIGLATVQRVIRRHGGEVWAEGA
ncbi:MAG: PAS domain S-box protein, partial [Thermomicrobiales bacterium]